MLKTWKQNLKHLTSAEYEFLRQMCRLSKNVYNSSVYNIRQHYFAEGTYLRYEANYPLMKTSEDYSLLGANIAQQSMRCADAAFKSFFGLLKLAKSGKYESWQVRLPKYLPKDGFYKLCLTQAGIKNGKFLVPTSPAMKKKTDVRLRIAVPKYLLDKKIHQIHIIPKHNGHYFEVAYMFDDVEPEIAVELDYNKALGIDFGINNFATCVTNSGEPFIIDGKKLKSINQWYNKELSRLSSIKDKQKIKKFTKRQYLITRNRNNQIQDFMHCAAKYIVNYCLNNHIGNIVVGYNDGFQQNVKLGKVNNQNFVMIPFGKFKNRLEYLCNRYNIYFQQQEESYTSKSSFFDNDIIPKWNPLNPVDASFSGRRITRGSYKTAEGYIFNADVNGALNILRKSNLVSLQALQARGEVIPPLRIRKFLKLRMN